MNLHGIHYFRSRVKKLGIEQKTIPESAARFFIGKNKMHSSQINHNTNSSDHETEKFLRRKNVEKLTGLSRSSIYLQMQLGKFPKPIKLTGTGKAVAWISSEIDTWMQERINQCR